MTIVDDLIQSIEESDPKTWKCPWDHRIYLPTNALTKRPYTGVNLLNLWCSDKTLPIWATYLQWQELGAQVRKGEKSTHVVFYTNFDPDDERSLAKHYRVFNMSQVDGYELKIKRLPKSKRIRAAEQFFLPFSSLILYESSVMTPRYIPSQDVIMMPPFASWKSAENYYAALAHELMHRYRCTSGGPTWDYATEEVIAEFGAAILCASLQIESNRKMHASYIKGWAAAMKQDKRLYQRMAATAQKTVNLITAVAGMQAVAA